MPRGVYNSHNKRGPKPAGAIPRNPANDKLVYVQLGRCTYTTEPDDVAAVEAFKALSPDEKLAAVKWWNNFNNLVDTLLRK